LLFEGEAFSTEFTAGTLHPRQLSSAARLAMRRSNHAVVPAAELARWKAALDAMKEDGSYRRILADYDYDPPP